MGKIDELTILHIKETAKIEDIVGDFCQLKKSGVEYVGLCPFHNDRHIGSFKVSPKKNIAICFSCGWSGDSIKFLMDHANLSYRDALCYIARRYGIMLSEARMFNYVPPPPKPPPPELPMLVLPMTMVDARKNLREDLLCRWIASLPWDECQMSRIRDVLTEYHVGHSRQGHTIFWQIDDQGRVRTGKMMKYKSDGHRDKQAPWNFDYIHSTLFRAENLPQYNSEKVEVRQTLFGMHLLKKYPGATVNIVESEKTALIAAIAWGNHPMQVWMACGGKENLNAEKLSPILEGKHRIVIWPDRDASEQWKTIAQDIGASVNTKYLDMWWKPEDGEKADIADVIVRGLYEAAKNPLNVKTIDDVIELMPYMKKPAEDLKLQVQK